MLVRIDEAIADGSIAGVPALRAAFEAGRRAHAAPRGPGRRRRRARQPAPPAGADRPRPRGRRRAHRRPRVHRRARHAARRGPGGRVRDRGDRRPSWARSCGRYWAMDRDRRWDRTKRAYDALVHGIGEPCASGRQAVAAAYEAGVTDEFIEPAVIGAARGEPHPLGRRGDLLELPARPRAPAHAGPERPGLRRLRPRPRPGDPGPDHDDPLQGRVHAPGAVRGPGRARGPRRVRLARRAPAAARGRDREVRARHLLLQRRPRGAVRGRAAGAGAVPAARARPTTWRPR